jgi:hypothetical protein
MYEPDADSSANTNARRVANRGTNGSTERNGDPGTERDGDPDGCADKHAHGDDRW